MQVTFFSLYLQCHISSEALNDILMHMHKKQAIVSFTEYNGTATAAGYFVNSRSCLLFLSVTWDVHFSKTTTGKEGKTQNT